MLGASLTIKLSGLMIFGMAVILAASPSSTVRADDVSFAGKQISVIIGSTAGGGTDGASRLIARFFQQYLPGNPRMVYRNMPAGNGTQATNYFANDAARDGTAWMAGDNSYISANALRDSVTKYDPRTFNFIGGVVRGGNIIIMAKDKQANLTDRSKPPVVIGTPTNMNTGAELMVWAAEALGWNLRFVIGYSGTPGMALALRGGEIDMFTTSSLNILQPLEETGNFIPVLQAGQYEDGKVVPRSAYETTPVFSNLAQGRLSGLTAEALDYWLKSDQIDKWFALPPKVSTDIVKTYRIAFEKLFNDPEFIKAGKLQFSTDFSAQSPEDISAVVNVRSYPRSELINEIRRLKEKHGLPGEPLTDEELAALSVKLVKMLDVQSAIVEVERDGRAVHFKAGDVMHKVEVSDGRTEVTIGGMKDKRASLKPGMTCRIVYPNPDSEAKSIDCM